MKREKLNTKEFKGKARLYNNFVEYFDNIRIQNYDGAKCFLREIVYDSNLEFDSKKVQLFVKDFDIMREDVEDSYNCHCNRCRSVNDEGLIARLRYLIELRKIKQTYQNFAKFELEFFDRTHISLLQVRKDMIRAEKTSVKEAAQ